MMSPVVGTLTPESYSSVMSGGPPPPPVTAGDGRDRKARDRRRPVGCSACQLPDGTVALSCHWKRACPVSRRSASVAYSKGAHGGQSCGQVYLKMVHGSHSVPFLIDTGCELSLAPLKLVKDVQLSPTDRRVCAADVSDIRILGAERLQFRLNGLVTQAHVLVTEVVEKPMLGIDWLVEHRCFWDFRCSLLYVDERPLEM